MLPVSSFVDQYIFILIRSNKYCAVCRFLYWICRVMFLCIKCKFLEITPKKNQSNQKIRTIYKRIAFRSSLEIGNIKLLILKYKSILFYIFIYSKQHLTSLLEICHVYCIV